MVTFGGAYAVLAYVAQRRSSTYGWLAPGEMLDGLGLAETTPGPLILVLAVRRLPGRVPPRERRSIRSLAGVLGAALTTLGDVRAVLPVDLPRRAVHRGAARAAQLSTARSPRITAAVVGVVLNLAVWFALHVVFRGEPALASLDPVALAIAVAALLAMLRFHVGMLPTLAASALLGVITRWIAAAS